MSTYVPRKASICRRYICRKEAKFWHTSLPCGYWTNDQASSRSRSITVQKIPCPEFPIGWVRVDWRSLVTSCMLLEFPSSTRSCRVRRGHSAFVRYLGVHAPDASSHCPVLTSLSTATSLSKKCTLIKYVASLSWGRHRRTHSPLFSRLCSVMSCSPWSWRVRGGPVSHRAPKSFGKWAMSRGASISVRSEGKDMG